MKECRYCKKSYPESYFGVALTTPNKIYRRHKCKFCYLGTKRILRKKNRTWLINYKKSLKCKRCNNSDYRVLEFHHIDSAKKEFSIATAFVDHYGLDKIKQEIKKCDILCSNCHRILHWEEHGWQ